MKPSGPPKKTPKRPKAAKASASIKLADLPKPKTYKVDGVLVTESSGNLWRDLGYPDAETRQAKSILGAAIRRHLEALGLNQSDAAKRLKIARPRISEIFNGHLDSYTIDRLSELLIRLGANIRIIVSYDGPAGVYVVAPESTPGQ